MSLPSSVFPSCFPSKFVYETKFHQSHACYILDQSRPPRLPITNNMQVYWIKPSTSGS